MTFVHPIAGAIAAWAPDYGGGLATHVPMAVFGAALALSAHGGKMTVRAGTTVSTGGTGNMLQSICGTATLIAVCIAAIAAAIISVILAVAVMAGCIYSLVKIRQAMPKRDLAMRGVVMPAVAAVHWRTAAQRNQASVTPRTPLATSNATGTAGEASLQAVTSPRPAEV